jgi:hypothetical protein
MARSALVPAIVAAALLALPALAEPAAMRLAQLDTAETQPEPAAGAFTEPFDGDALSADWEILNADPDSYFVENGALNVIGKAVGGLAVAETPNVFRLKHTLPDGDWTATLVFRAALQTGREVLEFGLYDDPGNMVVANFLGDSTPCCAGAYFSVGVVKWTNGTKTGFSIQAAQGDYATLAASIGQPITLKLVKKGRSYNAAVNLAGEADESGQPKWYETGVVTAVRAPKGLVINASQWDQTGGETLYTIESLTIAPTGE